MTILTGTAYWTHIQEPNMQGEFASGKYEIVLGNLDNAAIAAVKAMGMGRRLMEKENELGTHIKIKNKTQPKVIDKQQKEISPVPLVGNGSKVRIQVSTYELPKFGKQIGWDQLMILDLKEFTKGRPMKNEFANDGIGEVA